MKVSNEKFLLRIMFVSDDQCTNTWFQSDSKRFEVIRNDSKWFEMIGSHERNCYVGRVGVQYFVHCLRIQLKCRQWLVFHAPTKSNISKQIQFDGLKEMFFDWIGSHRFFHLQRKEHGFNHFSFKPFHSTHRKKKRIIYFCRNIEKRI